ncbi:hypothetical protein [Halalkalibacter urbisdiaboli]|uniref:hypothetical protein n=1 Tax=Halalkalibacter urbisdiaboli TaxID=1960589 RepID=UPI0013FD4669|nr:hypothetical protein [Halalkalibacter urbisdiaboli]
MKTSYIFRKKGKEIMLTDASWMERAVARAKGYVLVNVIDWKNTSKCKDGAI